MADKDKTATESTTPVGPTSVRGDSAPTPALDREVVGPTKEQEADAKDRDELLEGKGTDSADDKDHTTDHIPGYGQTHATPGIPYQENPLNPGMNPTILPGPAPEKS
jgi:hypothetical protein